MLKSAVPYPTCLIMLYQLLVSWCLWRIASAAPKCGYETFGQGYDPFFITLHGNGYEAEWSPKRTVFFSNTTFSSSCGDLPGCVKDVKSCDVEEHLFSTLIEINNATYLSEAMSTDIEISVTKGASFWKSTSTMSVSFEENVEVLADEHNVVFLQGGHARIWSGTCTMTIDNTYFADDLYNQFTKMIANPSQGPFIALQIVEDYGPTVAVGAHFGGVYTTTFYSNDDLFASYKEAAVDYEQGIGDSGYFWSVGGSASGQVETADGQLFELHYTKRISSSIGIAPPSDGSSYVTAIGDNCVPIYLELMALHDVVSARGIEGYSESEVYTIVKLLEQAERIYCIQMGGCKQTEPTPMPTASPTIFGGMYLARDDGEGIPNAYTGEKNCPIGYTAYQVGRSLASESDIGEITYLCLLSTSVDPTDNFGGAYQRDDTDQTDSRVNPMTGDLSCPDGYETVKYGRVTTAEPNYYGAVQYYCHKEAEPLGTAYIGGFYQLPDEGQGNTADLVGNYYTNAASCPESYTAYKIARQLTPDSPHVGANQYVCLNNI